MVNLSAVRGELIGMDDTQALQAVQLQGLASEVLYLQRLQPYGFSSVPPIGTEVLVLFINGRSHGYVVADADTNRPTGNVNGNTVFYDAHGNQVTLTSAGIALTPAPGLPVIVNGNLQVTGQVSDAQGSMAEMRTVFNSHTHGGGAGPSQLMN